MALLSTDRGNRGLFAPLYTGKLIDQARIIARPGARTKRKHRLTLNRKPIELTLEQRKGKRIHRRVVRGSTARRHHSPSLYLELCVGGSHAVRYGHTDLATARDHGASMP